jgi:plasmid stability protein
VSAITLKSVPEDLSASLKAVAAENHRSLNGEILYRLGRSLENDHQRNTSANVLREEAAIQADAWSKLGTWVSDKSVEEEIASLYEARSTGRDIDVSW